MIIKKNPVLLLIVLGLSIVTMSFSNIVGPNDPYLEGIESISLDTLPPNNYILDNTYNPFDLTPDEVTQDVEYDSESGMYIVREKIGDEYYRMPTYMTFNEYLKWRGDNQDKQYRNKLAGLSTGRTRGISGALNPIDEVDVTGKIVDRLFGGTDIVFETNGSIDLTFGGDYQKVDNPRLPENQRKTGGFDFDMAIKVNATGKIGDKLNLTTNYNTLKTFDFEDQIKLEYGSDNFSEDEILKNVDIGNVSLPLKSSLIQGSQNLMGIRTDLQFGHLRLSTIAAIQKSKSKNIQVQGGGQLQDFEVPSDEYDENRHFFLSHYNRNAYEDALATMSTINTLFRITRMEVWVTNDNNIPENVRNIIGFTDLGEVDRIQNSNISATAPPHDIYGNPLVSNESNSLYEEVNNNPLTRNLTTAISSLQTGSLELKPVEDFELVQARKLRSNEFTYHPELGFLSLNIRLRPDQILGVSYEYDYNGQSYKVGEFAQDESGDSTNIHFVKLLKSTSTPTSSPMWDLMMKNVYSLNAYQISQEDFRLDIYYEDPGEGLKRFLPKSELAGQPLINVFNLDKLNSELDPQPDGRFDFVPGITILPQTGRIILPVLEPFGDFLYENLDGNYKSKYSYLELYDSTLTKAREYPEKNRFTIKGTYKSGQSSEIDLNSFNIPKNSVHVSAGGRQLKEGIDYEIDYNIGKVRILNDAIMSSGTPINIRFEDNSLFNSIQTKTMLGLRADYDISENLSVGGTYMHLFEKPYTEKVNIGDDPISNRMLGLDMNFSKEVPWLTRLVDKIPLIDTKAPSNVNFSAEVAGLKPGHAKGIEQIDKVGSVYLDDFEGSASSYDLKTPNISWKLASIPQNGDFPEATDNNELSVGANRALLSWYTILDGGNSSSDNYTASIEFDELFPNRQQQAIVETSQRPFDLTYYPNLRGPYNYDIPNGGYETTAGLNQEGELNAPETRWAGIMRDFRNTDFEAANFEYVEFWLLNPFEPNSDGDVTQNGDLYLNLGSISEDVLKDGRKTYENGLPKDGSNTGIVYTNLARLSTRDDLTHSFDNDPDVRVLQDVGLDGMNDDAERLHFGDWLNTLNSISPSIVDKIREDPSNDNFVHYRDLEGVDDYLLKYQRYNGTEGNSKVASGGNITQSTNYPDTEDLNLDNNLNQSESYFEYHIPIKNNGSNQMEFNEFILDTISGPNGRIWYRCKVPLHTKNKKAIGGIQDFRSIRFIRMYLKNFDKKVTFRFATLDLIRNQWRRYTRGCYDPGVIPNPNGSSNVNFDINSVNIEEHSTKVPFNYVLPPGVSRENSYGSYQNVQQNEQSLSLKVENLDGGTCQSVYKNLNLDLRNYDTLRMFVHAEELNSDMIDDGDLSVFIRLGSDFEENYYEYEIPLSISRIISALPEDEEYKENVWKKENEFFFSLKSLVDLKVERNNSGQSAIFPFIKNDPRDEFAKNEVTVVGNPNLGLVKSIMIGIKNLDNEKHNIDVWVNELRVSGLDERGGVAALANMDVQLADFGNVAFSGSFHSVGWGGLDQKLAQRSKEQLVQYDASLNLELGKFFPERFGVHIPFFIQYSNSTETPEYDPYDLDIKLKDKVNSAEKSKQDSIKDQAVNRFVTKGYNFTNVKIDKRKKDKKPMPWDISNFSATYAYTQINRSDPVIEKDQIDKYKGAVDYNYSRKVKYLKPFKKLIKKDKYLKLFTEFGINPIPNVLGFNTALDRHFGQTKYRFTGTDPALSTYFDKRFTWGRNYNLKWDITKQLKFDFKVQNKAIIDEPMGLIDTQEKKDSIISNLKNLGRTKTYNHNIRLDYSLPTKNIPFLGWTKISASIDAMYNWNAAPLNADSLGNVIQNHQTRKLNADFNFEKLYNKSKYLKKINKGKKKKSKKKKGRKGSEDEKSKSKTKTDPKPKSSKKKKTKQATTLERALIRPLMALRKVSFTYSENFGSTVPGFTPSSRLFGQNDAFTAPGLEYALGFHPTNSWFDSGVKAENDWFTHSIFLNQQVLKTYSQKYSAKIAIEPYKGFKVDVDLSKTYSDNFSEQFKIFEEGESFNHRLPTHIGKVDMTYLTLQTLFSSDISDVFKNFEERRTIISDRLDEEYYNDSNIPHSIDTIPNGNGDIYLHGYGKKQQDVLIYSFLSAYSKQNASTYKLDVFNRLPLPNWKLSYRGLSDLDIFDGVLKSFSLTHGYKSNLTVANYETSRDYQNKENHIDVDTDNYYSELRMNNIVIREAFSPLLGLDVKFENDMSLRIDYKKSRDLSLSFDDYKLTENKATEFVFGFSYKFQDVYIKWLDFESKLAKTAIGKANSKRKSKKNSSTTPSKGKKGKGKQAKKKGNNLIFDVDFSYRDDVSNIYLIDDEREADGSIHFAPTRGSKTYTFSPSIDYEVNKNLALRLFFDYRWTDPKVSTSFKIVTAKGGLTIKLLLN